jgi:hypothetical protein
VDSSPRDYWGVTSEASAGGRRGKAPEVVIRCWEAPEFTGCEAMGAEAIAIAPLSESAMVE